MKTITVLIPCHNEAMNIPYLYEELVNLPKKTSKDYAWEFLFINDGSKDNTLQKLEDLRSNDERITVIDLSRNFGKEAAMLAGFDKYSLISTCKNAGIEPRIWMEDVLTKIPYYLRDGKDLSELLPRQWAKLGTNHADSDSLAPNRNESDTNRN